MERRGMGHIEVILAFVLFIGFLIFALFFFNPLDVDRVVDSSIYYAIDEISDNISVEVVSYSVVLEETFGAVRIPMENSENYNVRVENSEGERLNAEYTGGALIVDTGNERFLNVIFSEIFEEISVTGTPDDLDEGDYTISSSDIREVWSEKKALELNESYHSNYESVHEDFNLPDRVNFGFVFEILDGNGFRAEREIPEGLDVWGETERKEAIDLNGGMMFADLTVRVW